MKRHVIFKKDDKIVGMALAIESEDGWSFGSTGIRLLSGSTKEDLIGSEAYCNDTKEFLFKLDNLYKTASDGFLQYTRKVL